MSNVSESYREPLSFEMKEYTSGTKFQKGDSVIARIEPCLQNGKKFFCKDFPEGFGSTEFLVFRPKNSEKTDARYLYYFLQSDSLVKKMVGSMTGATGRQRVNNAVFNDIEINFPEFDEQCEIADLLSKFDDLIECDRKWLSLLIESSRRLFHELIASRADADKASIPDGWVKTKLNDSVLPVITGKKDANYGTIDGNYPFFTCSQEPIKSPGYSFDTNAVILAGNGDFNVKLYRGKFEAYQRTYVLSPYNSDYLYLVYHSVESKMRELAKGASGSTIKFLTKGMIQNIDMVIPDDIVLEEFNSMRESIQQKIELLNEEIRTAEIARDYFRDLLISY